jgi:putative colanic acid biosynthesis acetyltransferase WcaB
MGFPGMGFRAWVIQDWSVNAGRPEVQLILAWFRLAQWADRHWGRLARPVVSHYWLTTSLVFSIELPVTASVGPRLRVYHPHGIVLSPHCTIGSDCHLRHGVTVGNRTDRDGNDIGVASIGDHVELGASCAVIGDLHVGDHARIGALAVVVKSAPAWSVVVGNPGRVVRVDEPSDARRPNRLPAS